LVCDRLVRTRLQIVFTKGRQLGSSWDQAKRARSVRDQGIRIVQRVKVSSGKT